MNVTAGIDAAQVSLHSASTNSTIAVGQMLRPGITGGKVAVPVQNYSVFTRFKHINATPAPANSPGYSASRLRILDNLIDRLIQMKERSLEKESRNDVSGLSSEAIDALIQQYAGTYKNLASKGADSLSSSMGMNFGVKESNTAELFNVLA